MRGFYCELWVKTHTYYARSRGEDLKKVAAEVGKLRPEKDKLNRFTWTNEKPFVKAPPKRWG